MAYTFAAALLILLIGPGEAGIAPIPIVDRQARPFPAPPSASTLGNYTSAAVTSDVDTCSQIGRDTILFGGNAVDAAVATLFCIGVMNPQNSGIGGGMFMTIYDPKNCKATCIDGREVAPLNASQTMFGSNSNVASSGPLSIAVPGELAGSWAAWKAYGRLPWKMLVMPSALMAMNGVRVTKSLAGALQIHAATIMANPSLSFFINPRTKKVWQQGDVYAIPNLGDTLMAIANQGASAFYEGNIADMLVSDLRKLGSIITLEDLKQYRSRYMTPVRVNLNGFDFYSHPPPASGGITAYILNILKSKLSTNGVALNGNSLTYHWIVEAFKHGFGQRTKQGDPDFVPTVNDLIKNLTSDAFASAALAKIVDNRTFTDPTYYGAQVVGSTRTADDSILDAVRQTSTNSGLTHDSHISVIDSDGMAVSVTSGINAGLGSLNASVSTGVLMNSEMGDFSAPGYPNQFGLPPSRANFIQPGKRPQSSKTPSILVDSKTDRVRMVIGTGSPGPAMIVSTVQAIIRNLWFGENIKQSTDDPRLYHQLLPMILQAEDKFPSKILQDLRKLGHNITTGGFSSVNGISAQKEGQTANADFRVGGSVAGFG